MTESKEREAYRMKCKYHGVNDNCIKQSSPIQPYFMSFVLWTGHMSVACTPDCDCARMRRYDKRKKQE